MGPEPQAFQIYIHISMVRAFNEPIDAELNVLGNRLASIKKNSLQNITKKINHRAKVKHCNCRGTGVEAHVPQQETVNFLPTSGSRVGLLPSPD